jgi:glucokinase
MSTTPFTALGIDVGGTKIAFGVVRFPAGELLEERIIATRPGRPALEVLENVVTVANELGSGVRKTHDVISGVGVGLCELVGLQGQILSHNLLDWNERQLESALEHLAPVTIEADVRAAARAEAIFGAGRQFRILLYVTVGTGIACSLVIDTVPYFGARGATGTMASSPLTWACASCGHINRRTLEQIASGPGVVERANQEQPGKFFTGQQVFAAAEAGDTSADEVIQTAGRALESTVALMVNVLDPEAVIIGGGLGLSEGPFWSSFIQSTREHIWSDAHRDLPILRAATGSRAGMIGAALAAWKAAEYRS